MSSPAPDMTLAEVAINISIIVGVIGIGAALLKIGSWKGNVDSDELLSNVVYGRPEFSGPPARFFFFHSVDEPHVGDHVGQMTEAA